MPITGQLTFTGSDGTAVTSLTPEVGTIAKHTSTSGATTPIVASNRCRAAQQTTDVVLRFTGTAPSADTPVIGTIRRFSGIGILDLWVRLSSSSLSGYRLRWQNGSFVLIRDATSLTSLSHTWNTGTDRLIRFQAVTNGSQVDLTVHVNGVLLVSYSDTSGSRITTTGNGGWGHYETESPSGSTGFHLDSIQVGEDPALSVTEPTAYQVYQRGSGGTAVIHISGVCGDAATAIEASWNGGAYEQIAVPSMNAYSGTITRSAGQGTLRVRYVNDTNTYVDVPYVGVGEVFAIAGQSNAVGWGTNSQSYSGSLKACVFGNDYTWKELSDPVDSAAGQVDSVSDDTGAPAGSYWPHAATDLMAALGVPVAFVPCAKAATAITAWLPGVNHLNRSTLYGSMNYRIQQVRGVRLLLWHQGEAEALAQTSQASYNADLDTIANALKTDAGCRLMACLLQNSSGAADVDEAAIRAAVVEAAGDNPNVLVGPDFSDLASDDSFHLQTDQKLTTAGQRWAARLLASGVFSGIPVFMHHYRQQGIC